MLATAGQGFVQRLIWPPPHDSPVDHKVHMAACHNDASRLLRDAEGDCWLHSLTSPLHRPYVGLIHDRYLQFRYPKWRIEMSIGFSEKVHATCWQKSQTVHSSSFTWTVRVRRPKWDRNIIYPLVNVHIAMERSTIFHGKIHYKWQFSIAMLVHQRVYKYMLYNA